MSAHGLCTPHHSYARYLGEAFASEEPSYHSTAGAPRARLLAVFLPGSLVIVGEWLLLDVTEDRVNGFDVAWLTEVRRDRLPSPTGWFVMGLAKGV